MAEGDFKTPTKTNWPHMSLSNDRREECVDYKAKTFKLMRQLAQTEVKEKKSQFILRQLQREMETYAANTKKLFGIMGVTSFEQACQIASQSGLNEFQEKEWARIIEEYKAILNSQQVKLIKFQQQCKMSEIKAIKLTQAHIEQTKKTEEKINQLQDQCNSLKTELQLLKDEYRKIVLEKDKTQQRFLSLQEKYNIQIQHFEQIERTVEERLGEVDKQMTSYKQERENHLTLIDQLNKEIAFREAKAYYSFGGVQHVLSQTEELEQDQNQSQICLEISIRTLLEQNSRLKKTLLAVHNRGLGEVLSDQDELELKILLSMQRNQKSFEEYLSPDLKIKEETKPKRVREIEEKMQYLSNFRLIDQKDDRIQSKIQKEHLPETTKQQKTQLSNTTIQENEQKNIDHIL